MVLNAGNADSSDKEKTECKGRFVVEVQIPTAHCEYLLNESSPNEIFKVIKNLPFCMISAISKVPSNQAEAHGISLPFLTYEGGKLRQGLLLHNYTTLYIRIKPEFYILGKSGSGNSSGSGSCVVALARE